MSIKRIVVTLVAIVTVLSVMGPAVAAPLRSGTIVGGYFVGGSANCTITVDCRAWLESGCNRTMVGVDPGLHTSIVNVAKIASSYKTRTFRVVQEPTGIKWGGVTLQFWRRDCTELRPYPAIGRGILWTESFFKIPPGVQWMTVTSSDNTTLRWTLQ